MFYSIFHLMRIEFNRNIHFTKLLKTSGRVREFNFRKVGGLPEQQFHVDVSDDRGNRIIFRMQKAEKGQWWLLNEAALPAWISDIEHQLHGMIEAGMSEEEHV